MFRKTASTGFHSLCYRLACVPAMAKLLKQAAMRAAAASFRRSSRGEAYSAVAALAWHESSLAGSAAAVIASCSPALLRGFAKESSPMAQPYEARGSTSAAC
jgi:hypothetical protein